MGISCPPDALCPSCDDDKLISSDDGIVCFSCGEVYSGERELKRLKTADDWSPMGLNRREISQFKFFVRDKPERNKNSHEHDRSDVVVVDGPSGAVVGAPEVPVHVLDERGQINGSGECDHADRGACCTREGDIVCVDCGGVMATGCDLFHFGRLHDGAYTYRKGTYRIKYYFNEKLAQWCRQCPVPDDDTFDRFVEEARNVGKYGRPKDFGRGDIAKICKSIGRSTMQEKWLLLMEMLVERDPVYFGSMKIPPKPSPRLINEVRRLFHHSLPAWNMCKDIDVTEYSGGEGTTTTTTTTLDLPVHSKKTDGDGKRKKRKSYPHNYMIRRFLFEIQQWYPGDSDLGRCYDVHDPSIKRVSENIEVILDVIYVEMAKTMNDSGFTLMEH